MIDFTFDGRFHFIPAERLPGMNYDWYVCTLGSEFRQGKFDADGGLVKTDGQRCDERLSEEEISEIGRQLREHRGEMDLRQFDVHKRRPDHHVEIPRDSDRFAAIDALVNDTTLVRGHPAMHVAMRQLEQANPAYRLTREHVRQALELCEAVTEDEIMEEIEGDLQDSWSYDIVAYVEPSDPIQTYEQLRESELQALKRPTPAAQRFYRTTQMWEVEGVTGLYLFESEEARPRHRVPRRLWYHAPFRGVVLDVHLPGCFRDAFTYVI